MKTTGTRSTITLIRETLKNKENCWSIKNLLFIKIVWHNGELLPGIIFRINLKREIENIINTAKKMESNQTYQLDFVIILYSKRNVE